ncbi:unnamed protein product, partial [marine sediment metagenome]
MYAFFSSEGAAPLIWLSGITDRKSDTTTGMPGIRIGPFP